MRNKKIEFQTEPGHSETIFDIWFKPSDKNILASWSYDGSIKIWDAPSMKMIMSIHSEKKIGEIGHSVSQKPGGNNTIYGISWAPQSDEIACIGGKGWIKVFNSLKGTLKYEITPGGKGFRIAWNQLNGRYILSSSVDGYAYVLGFDEETHQLLVKKKFNHSSK